MSTRTPPASEAAPTHVPAPPSVPVRPRSTPPPGARTVIAAVLVALAGTTLLHTPPAATARAERPPATTTPDTTAVLAAPGPEAGRGSATAPRALAAQAAPGAPAPAAPAAPALAGAPVRFAGKAFDTCEAPSLTVMKAWRGSPYGAVGIYFGGRGRGCPVQKELTPAWVASAHAMGWRLLPLFVGSQAPCVDSLAKRRFAIGSAPATQGTKEGGDAVRAAKALGIGTSSPLYLDIEAYRRGDASCAATTLAFVRAWNREVRRLGYLPGFYSSADTGVRDMETQRRAGTKDLPDVMWFARWRGQPALLTESVLHPDAWTPHARIHQYAGNVTETYGGRTLAIDRNAMDAPVARVTAPARFTTRVPVPLSFVAGGRP
ncbi:DUF1906 domain-containing protein [Streptomyces sp. R44]|uniref:DUF1906 domain-containing protein n=1 Tax=Streptomyces sp. R44 TaxID=3238633 RepID=A0AB39SZL8_9ACTN